MEDGEWIRVFKAISDPTRRKILDVLRERCMTTGEICQQFSMSRFGVMKHLGILSDAHLVFSVREGRVRWNHLNPVPLKQVVDRWLEPFEELPIQGLVDLKKVVEGGQQLLETQSKTDSNKHNEKGKFMSVASKPFEKKSFHSYDVRFEIEIAGTPERVWQAMVGEIQWWPKHFFTSSDSRVFVVEPRVGGRIYEAWGGEAGALWGLVAICHPNEKIVWSGDIFPDFGGTGRYIASFELKEQAGKTIVHFRDSGFGAISPEAGKSMESGWRELVEGNLKPYVENGTRD